MITQQCPVEVGDIFYRNIKNQTIPDRIRVVEVKDLDGMFLIRGEYIYHAIGPTFERTFSDVIFQDPNWVIEKKGEQN